MQRHEDADGQVKPRRQVGDGDPDPGGLGAGHSRHAHQPAHALGDLIDPTALSIGSVLPEAGDRAVDEARVANVDRVVVETEPLLHRRTHVLDEDVGGLGQAPEDIATSLRLEVDGDGALVAMQVLIVGAMAALAGDPGAVRFSRRLDSYDVGAPVGELPDAGRPSARDREVEHPDVVERHGTVFREHASILARSSTAATRVPYAAIEFPLDAGDGTTLLLARARATGVSRWACWRRATQPATRTAGPNEWLPEWS